METSKQGSRSEIKIVTYSFRNLKRSKSRTILAILDVYLGIVLIISLLTVMDGLEASITDSLQLLSGNQIVQEKGAVNQLFSIVTTSLIDVLLSNEDIEAVSPEIYVVKSRGHAVQYISNEDYIAYATSFRRS